MHPFATPRRTAWPSLLVVLSLGCTHSDALLSPPVAALPPFSSGPDVQLTFNVEQDYWPMWTEDGQGILYAFSVPGSTVRHRCVGLLPAAGGSRLWEFCDNRAGQQDSTTSYTGFALSSTGRLLLASAVSDSTVSGHAPARYTLWLTDTATPFRRTALLTLPVSIGGASYGWLTDIAWTGPDSFVALAQDFTITLQPSPPCDFDQDSVYFHGGAVVTGTISGGHVTLEVVPGTSGATGYSRAEHGGSVVFILPDDQRLFKVPVNGGSVMPVSPPLGGAGSQLLGVSCRESNCVVAADSVALIPDPECARVTGRGPQALYGVSLATGASQLVTSRPAIIATPQVSPLTGDVVMAVGGSFGHLQTIRNPTDGNLHLLRGVVQE